MYLISQRTSLLEKSDSWTSWEGFTVTWGRAETAADYKPIQATNYLSHPHDDTVLHSHLEDIVSRWYIRDVNPLTVDVSVIRIIATWAESLKENLNYFQMNRKKTVIIHHLTIDGCRKSNLCVNSAGKASAYSRVAWCVLQTKAGLVSLRHLLSCGGVQQVIVTEGLHAVEVPGERDTESWTSPSLVSSSAYTGDRKGFPLSVTSSAFHWATLFISCICVFVCNNPGLTDDSCAIPTHAWVSLGGSLPFLGSSLSEGTAAELCNPDPSHSGDMQTWTKETEWAKMTSQKNTRKTKQNRSAQLELTSVAFYIILSTHLALESNHRHELLVSGLGSGVSKDTTGILAFHFRASFAWQSVRSDQREESQTAARFVFSRPIT